MKNVFYFSSTHRLAVLMLCVIIVSMALITDHFSNRNLEKDYVFTEFENEVNSLRKIRKKTTKTPFKNKKVYKSNYSKPKLAMLEINSADSLDFMTLPHIGSFFAKRIYKYRQLLGGFYSKSQLHEVYGMDSARFAQFQEYILVDTSLIKKHNINIVSEEELSKHPYISYKLAIVICNYRHQHGHFKSVQDMKNIHLIDSNKFCKIVPYITTK